MIEVNGKRVEWKKNETIDQLLERMKYHFPIVIVKIDGKTIHRKDFSRVTVPNNSKIDVIYMVSGG